MPNTDVVGDPAMVVGVYLTWSPDSTQIAFVSAVTMEERVFCPPWSMHLSQPSIWIIGTDGRNLRKIVEEKRRKILGLSWSPDGKKIAYARDTFISVNCSGLRPGERMPQATLTWDARGIRLVDVFSGEGTDLAEDTAFPAFSPDGSRIAYSGWGQFPTDIYIMNTDGSGKVRLINDGWTFNTPRGAISWGSGNWKPPTQSIKLIAPNGGETWYRGAFQTIRWIAVNIADDVKIELSIDSGANWTVLTNHGLYGGSFEWVVNSPASSQALVRVTSNWNPADVVPGAHVFTIAGDSIHIASPKAGEQLVIGSNYRITWTSARIGNEKVEISLDGGSTWSMLNSNQVSDDLNWWVAGPPTQQALVRVSKASDPSVFAISGMFSVVAAPPGRSN